jgi:hypothetical protein
MLTYLLETTYLWIYRLNFIGANTYYHWHWQVKGLDSYLIADMRMLANRPISSSRKFRSQAMSDRQKKLLPSEAIKSNFIIYIHIMHHASPPRTPFQARNRLPWLAVIEAPRCSAALCSGFFLLEHPSPKPG